MWQAWRGLMGRGGGKGRGSGGREKGLDHFSGDALDPPTWSCSKQTLTHSLTLTLLLPLLLLLLLLRSYHDHSVTSFTVTGQ